MVSHAARGAINAYSKALELDPQQAALANRAAAHLALGQAAECVQVGCRQKHTQNVCWKRHHRMHCVGRGVNRSIGHLGKAGLGALCVTCRQFQRV